jgi:cysteinyl-tRNA synthetase
VVTLRLRNTLGGQIETFQPREAGRVGMYTCGPTVYGPAHIGNFRSFVFADLLRRYLEWSGYQVTWVMNITDVDDRIIERAKQQGVSIQQLTAPHEEAFREALATLRIGPPQHLPRATEHIPLMADLVETLMQRGHAYRSDEGSIFYRIASWPAYGKLARLDPAQLRVGERVEADDYGKDDVRDFALWKAPKPGEPSWPTQIGEGRPGWHIECSAMSMRYLGPSFDIHTGGVDLIFPHHEDEIAQSEAATGQPFVRSWLHCAHLRKGGEKMARREGNIATPNEIYAMGFTPRALRYALMAVHYRQPMEYSEESLRAAAAAVERLSTALAALDTHGGDAPDDPSLSFLLDDAKRAFAEALDDDLNVSEALAVVFDLLKELNRRRDGGMLSRADAGRAAAFVRDLDRVLAVAEEDDAAASPEASRLLEAREQARAARDWSESDRLRDELLREHSIAVEDTRDGQRWRRVAGEGKEGKDGKEGKEGPGRG